MTQKASNPASMAHPHTNLTRIPRPYGGRLARMAVLADAALGAIPSEDTYGVAWDAAMQRFEDVAQQLGGHIQMTDKYTPTPYYIEDHSESIMELSWYVKRTNHNHGKLTELEVRTAVVLHRVDLTTGLTGPGFTPCPYEADYR